MSAAASVKPRVSQNVGHSLIIITVTNTLYPSFTHYSRNTYSTPSVCWKNSVKYCKIGFLNDSINIYSVPFMCRVLEKLNKYCKIGFLNDSRFQPNNTEV